jgi:hypothetical protein
MDTRYHKICDAVCDSLQVSSDIRVFAELLLDGSCFKRVGSVTRIKTYAYELKKA